MKTNGISIEQLAEKFGESVWVKGDLKRIYLNEAGWNTKKMRTKTFIFEKDGEFIVSCKIECPSQPEEWIESQEQQVKNNIYQTIEQVIWEMENPEDDFQVFKEKQQLEKEKEAKAISLNKLSEKKEKERQRNIQLREYWISEAEKAIDGNDNYAPFIHPIEQIFLKKYRHADESFESPIGNVLIGKTEVFIEDIVEWRQVRSQGKNGPNKKNVFAPIVIPQQAIDKMNAVLEYEKARRINDLKKSIAQYREELSQFIGNDK